MLSAGYKFIATNQGLTVRPCCVYDGEQVVNTREDIVQWRNSMNEIDSYQEPLCNNCNYVERSQVKDSRRQLSFQYVPDNAEVGDPAWLEIQTDLTCNGGCVTCGPWHSSYWAQELGQPIKISQREDSLHKISELVDLQRTNHVVILGGEPFLSDTDERLLDYIKDPSKVSLQITTNGSVYPNDKKLESWKHFKSVLLNFSIDGVGSRFEYLRYPLKWNRVEQNMLQLDQEASANVRCKINHTFTSLNLYYFDEFYQWYQHHRTAATNRRGWALTTTPAVGILSPQTVSHALQKLVHDRYGQQRPTTVIEHTVQSRPDLRAFLQGIDKRRGLSWKRTFSEIVQAL
jgi:hypothetical protein